MHVDPFQIERLPNAPVRNAAIAAARPLLSWLLALPTLRAIYERTQGCTEVLFATRALTALDVRLTCTAQDMCRIPKRGSLAIAANHPHGLLDGLLVAAAIGAVRGDVRILTNCLLSRIPELADLCFFVDPFGGPAAAVRSQAGLRAAHLWLRHGGALIVFPAGEVAHCRRRDGSYAESPWVSTVGRLVRSTSAQVLPAFIAGRNSRLFYTLGRIHGSLRTALLARELLKRRGLDVTVRLGPPVAADAIAAAPDAAAVTSVIRAEVDRLRLPDAESTPLPNGSGSKQGHTIAAEIARLPADTCLVDSGRFQVFCAQAEQIPSTLFEIGRLRETTFRAIGEGTGRTTDLDRFDHHYLHLFSWDRERRQVVGAYRLGQTDRIVETAGIAGLYTRTLFRYDTHLIGQLSPALELGRSFIRSEYQRNYNALLFLWKGIGQFVVRHPRYRVLFGLVSISSRYSDTSHRLLIAFLQQNYLDRALAELVEAVNPAVNKPPLPATVATAATVDEVSRLITHAESDGKGVPVLLRQYLKLNARLLGFNVDPDFGSALDALMMVDLTTVDRAILCRYLGRSEAAQFLERHRDGRSADAA